MENHFNKLTPAEDERLSVLAEECAEVIQIIQKIQRHGYASYNPYDKNKIQNRNLLEKELGHVKNISGMMTIRGDIKTGNINYHSAEKSGGIGKYLHHQHEKTKMPVLSDEDQKKWEDIVHNDPERR